MESQGDSNINLEKEVENGVNLELSITRACDVSNTSNNKTIAADYATLSSCNNSQKPYRHSNAQIQALEDLYSNCPYPTKNQMIELAQRISIDDAQVRYWFQNRHTRTKLRMEEYENKMLREENEMIMQENMANLEFLRRHMYCSRCLNGGMTLEELRMENIWLRKELARVIAHVEDVSGQPILALLSVVPDETSSPPPASSATTDDFLSWGPPNHV